VEDDPAARHALTALLESEGYLVDAAASLGEADARMSAEHPPDVVVLDMTLPDGDGAAWLTRRNQESTWTPPVIALTGLTAKEDALRIRSAGVRRMLVKPIDVAELLFALEDVLEAPRRNRSES